MATESISALSREVKIPCGDSGVTYREVVGFPDYAVGDDGSVWSSKSPGGRGVAGLGWRRLKGSVDASLGYVQVMMSNGQLHNGRRMKKMRVHRIVLEAFVGPCPPGMEACHDPDHDRTNNRLSNLRWGTRKSNVGDMIAHGRACSGERCVTAKLTWAIVDDIRSRFPGYLTRKKRTYNRAAIVAAAKEFNIHSESMYRILNERRWKPANRPAT